MDFSEKVRKAILITGLSIKAVSEKTGIPYRTLQGYFYGERTPNALTQEAVLGKLAEIEDRAPELSFSFECEDVIADLKDDIAEFGEDAKAYGVYVLHTVKVPFSHPAKTCTVEFLVNYLLDVPDCPPTEKELEGGRAEMHTLGELLVLFEDENKIF